MKLLVVASAGVLMLSACSSGGGDAALSPSASPAPTEATASATASSTPSASASATPEPSEAVKSLPAECAGYAGSQDTEGDPIAAAVASVDLPDAISLMGTQVLASTDEEGKFDAVIRVCSDELTDDEVFALGTELGAAIDESAATDTVATLRLTSWVPDGSGSITEATKIRCDDFQIYLWEDALSDDSNWELAGRDY